MERIAVVGAGAMGTLLGACLNRNGIHADLIDVDQRNVDNLNHYGARVIGKTEFTVPVQALRPDQMQGTYDLVFLLIKQVYNQRSFAQVAQHLNEHGIVVTMQNGLPEPAVAAAFGSERTMGCAVTWAAELQEPGVTIAGSDLEMWNNNLGRLDGKITEQGKRIRELLSSMCHTELSDNLAGIRWSKLIINCSFSGMSAALGFTFGQVLEDPEALCCAQHIARECIRVVRAQGIRLHPIGAEGCLDCLMDFETRQERIATNWIYEKLFGSVRSGKASMLQDLEHSRPTEIHAINGVLSRKGREFGVPTPFCDMVVRLVEEIQEGKREIQANNLLEFQGLLNSV